MARRVTAGAAAVAVVAGFNVATGSPASADHSESWPGATTEIPHPADGWRFVVQGPAYTWGARRALQNADDRVHAIDVVNGRCTAYPGRVCIRIRFYNEPDGRCGGTATALSWRTIRLNRWYPSCQLPEYRHAVGAHEAGHAFGGDHEPGVRSWLGEGWVTLGTRFDMDELRVTYRPIRYGGS